MGKAEIANDIARDSIFQDITRCQTHAIILWCVREDEVVKVFIATVECYHLVILPEPTQPQVFFVHVLERAVYTSRTHELIVTLHAFPPFTRNGFRVHHARLELQRLLAIEYRRFFDWSCHNNSISIFRFAKLQINTIQAKKSAQKVWRI